MPRHFAGPSSTDRVSPGLQMLLEVTRILPPFWLAATQEEICWWQPDMELALASALHLFTITPVAIWEIQRDLRRALDTGVPWLDGEILLRDGGEDQVLLSVAEAWRIVCFGSIE